MVGEMGDRNTPAPFEPPPWEKSQFDELARRRAAAQEDADINRALLSLEEDSIEQVDMSVVEGQKEARDVSQSEGVPVKKKELPPQTEMLLAQLKTEEPDTSKSLWKIGLVFVLFVGIIGIVLVVWGATGLIAGRDNGATVIIGGSIMIFFGLLFAGTATWLAVRTMRQQGVL
jgi:hypothetical protein